MSNILKLGYIQTSCVADVKTNISQTANKIKDLAERGARIICLQELFSTLYFCNEENHDFFNYAEQIPGTTTDFFQQVARQFNVVLVLSLFEKRAMGLYHNTAVVIDADGCLLGIYRKSHIPDDPGFYEKFYFTPGDTGYKVFETKFAKIGVLVCWDQWYPEAARITSLMGAEVLFYPTAIGWDINEADISINDEQYNAWQTIQRAHAIANGVHVVSVNRIGQESGTRFWGGSFVANPFGSLIYLSNHDDEDLPTVDIDLDKSEYYRRTWPFLRDRRIDNYKPILKRFID